MLWEVRFRLGSNLGLNLLSCSVQQYTFLMNSMGQVQQFRLCFQSRKLYHNLQKEWE